MRTLSLRTAVAVMALPTALAGQILPPIARPLATSRVTSLRTSVDTLRRQAEVITAHASALRTAAQNLRTNEAPVAATLLLLAQEAASAERDASRLLKSAESDSGAADLLLRLANDARDLQAKAVQASIAAKAKLDSLPPLHQNADSAAMAADRATRQVLNDLLHQAATDSAHFAQQFRAFSDSAKAARDRSRTAFQRASDIGSQSERLANERSALEADTTDRNRNAAALDQQATAIAGNAGALRTSADSIESEITLQGTIAKRILFPAKSRVEAMEFYGDNGLAFLRNLTVGIETNQSASSTTEVASDYAGPVRIAMNVVVATAKQASDSGATASKSNATAIERFYAGGGTATFTASWPVLFSQSHYHSLTVQTLDKASFDVNGGLSSQVSDTKPPANVDLGGEAYLTLSTYGEVFQAFALGRLGRAYGDGPWQSVLGLTSGTFRYTQLTGGLAVQPPGGVPGFKILATAAWGPGAVHKDFSWAIQLAPKR